MSKKKKKDDELNDADLLRELFPKKVIKMLREVARDARKKKKK
jgi:hypothetical protein